MLGVMATLVPRGYANGCMKKVENHCLDQCSSTGVPRNPRVPQNM